MDTDWLRSQESITPHHRNEEERMDVTDQEGRKYNVTLSRLIQMVVGMSEKQQLIMLRLAEELLYRHKKPVSHQDLSAITRSRPAHPRKPSSLIVNFSAGNRFYTDYIEDIHPKGLFIGTQEDFKIGEELALAFSHPKFPDIFRVYGDISHIREDGIGVQFKNLTKPQEDRIKALVDWLKGAAP
jgi:Tfp pilus assembly protein PilZ